MHVHDPCDDNNLDAVVQTAVFGDDDPDRDAHRANAPIEMPAALFVQAVHLACEIPPISHGIPAECEQHPAVRLLCDWWDTVRPASEPLRPGSFMPWVRVQNDGRYWAGYYEGPHEHVQGFNPRGTDCARVGDALLVLFYAEQAAAFWKEEALPPSPYGFSTLVIRRPSGRSHMAMRLRRKDVEDGGYDEARFSLEALRAFPERFPALWAALSQVSEALS